MALGALSRNIRSHHRSETSRDLWVLDTSVNKPGRRLLPTQQYQAFSHISWHFEWSLKSISSKTGSPSRVQTNKWTQLESIPARSPKKYGADQTSIQCLGSRLAIYGHPPSLEQAIESFAQHQITAKWLREANITPIQFPCDDTLTIMWRFSRLWGPI